MAQSYVVQTATLSCSYGDKTSKYQVPVDHETFINDKPQGNINDHKPNINILPFGLCSSLSNPTVAKATAANKGRLKKMPCVPATTSPWINGKPDVLLENQPALLNTSTLRCNWCGIIKVEDDGQ